MNDGIPEMVRAPTIPNSSDPNSDSPTFGHAIARIAVAQLCERLGFQGFQQSAIETLSDIALKYVLLLGRESNFHSNLARRTTSTLSDLIRGIQDVNTIQGFSPPSDSSLIRDIALYINDSEDSSLLSEIPSFPLLNSTKTPPPSRPPAAHIPPWLPPFPDPKVYKPPPSSPENLKTSSKDSSVATVFVEEKSSVSLEHQLHQWNSFENLKDGGGVEKKATREKGFSLVEIFSPVMEGVERVPDSADLGRSLLLEQRRNARPRVGIGRTMSVNYAGACSPTGGGRDVHVKEVEKDERRKRAEKILKECMDNPNELLQM